MNGEGRVGRWIRNWERGHMLIMNLEKSPRARLSTKRHAICRRRSDDIWVLESREGNSGTEVRHTPLLHPLQLALS
jgi:hypothetical protein